MIFAYISMPGNIFRYEFKIKKLDLRKIELNCYEIESIISMDAWYALFKCIIHKLQILLECKFFSTTKGKVTILGERLMAVNVFQE